MLSLILIVRPESTHPTPSSPVAGGACGAGWRLQVYSLCVHEKCDVQTGPWAHWGFHASQFITRKFQILQPSGVTNTTHVIHREFLVINIKPDQPTDPQTHRPVDGVPSRCIKKRSRSKYEMFQIFSRTELHSRVHRVEHLSFRMRMNRYPQFVPIAGSPRMAGCEQRVSRQRQRTSFIGPNMAPIAPGGSPAVIKQPQSKRERI